MSQPTIVSPSASEYTQITTATTTLITGAAIFDGAYVVTGAAGNLTIYDNTAASGTKLVDTFATTTSNTAPLQNTVPPDGILLKNGGLAVVTSGTATVNIYYSRFIP